MHRKLLHDSAGDRFTNARPVFVSANQGRKSLFANGVVQMKVIVVLVAAMVLSLSAFSQGSEVTVTGRVTSQDDGTSLPGVNILQKDSRNGAVTDSEGNYSLRVSSDATLIFSFIGFQTVEVGVNNRSVIDVSLAPDMTQLDEVVVIGYGVQKKGDLTGSVGTVEAEQFEGRNISSFEEGLQGQTAGVHVVQGSGQPGGRTIVRIRGQNSIMGGNDPLYVVDGVPVQSGHDGNTSILATMNPNDIESIDILKDASATAIYGARGSNGVVLITTKRGAKDRHAVNFESSIGVSQVIKKLDVLNSRQFAQIANERATNDGQAIPFPDIDAVAAINTNWQDEIFQTALTQNYTLGFSGGTEQTHYFISGSYMDQEGAVINSGFNRGSFRMNLDQKVGDRLSLSSQMFVSRSKANRTSDAIIENAIGMPPINSPYDADGNFTPGDVLLSYPFSDSGGDSPLILAHERLDQLTIGRFLGNLRGRYKLFEDLTLELMLGADQTFNVQDSYSTRLIRGNSDGSASERRTETQYYVIEGVLQYATSINEGAHKINATAGFTREMQTSRFISAAAQGFVTDDFSNRNLGAGERFSAPSNDFVPWDILSFLGRVNYILNDKYLFTVSGRRDGSSRFGEGNKWGFFPSAAFAWRMANESFLTDSETVSDMKLRLSWGKTGNQAIAPFQSLQRFEPLPLVMGDNMVIGFAPDNLGNPDLKWETTVQLNAGVDVGLLDQRIRFSLDLYRKKTSDLLAVVNLPPNSGFRTTLQNIGSMENSGIEINTAVDIIRDKQDFNWTVNLNISANRNKVTELARGADIIAPNLNFVGPAHILREGEPLSSFYGVVEDGLTDQGLIKFVDQNTDGLINSLDRVILGDPYPDLTYGLNTQFEFKGFDLSIFIQGEEGKQLFNANKYYLASSFSRGTNNVVAVEDRWRPDDPNTSAAYPKASATLNLQWSDRFVEDASYMRVKNILLGYNLKLPDGPVRSARIFVSGQNLLTFTKYSWFDPDVNANASGDLRIGVDHNTFPVSKTVTVGLNIGL